jgi:hypothetical protein
VEEKAHGLALTKRRELKAEILSSKRRLACASKNLLTPGSQVPRDELQIQTSEQDKNI